MITAAGSAVGWINARSRRLSSKVQVPFPRRPNGAPARSPQRRRAVHAPAQTHAALSTAFTGQPSGLFG